MTALWPVILVALSLVCFVFFWCRFPDRVVPPSSASHAAIAAAAAAAAAAGPKPASLQEPHALETLDLSQPASRVAATREVPGLQPAAAVAWLSLAATPRGVLPSHAARSWSPAALATARSTAVTVSIDVWYALEHSVAASRAVGSGFVVDATTGLIVTNRHVAGDIVGSWEVLFADGSTTTVGDS